LSYPEGRSDDLLEFASGRIVHPQAIRSAFNEERSIWEYQVEQLTDSHFRVALLAAPACDAQATRQRVVDKLAAVLGSGVRIDVEFVDTIDRTIGGKSAPVISRRARQRRAAGR
jgi:phenylacetate-coenzyme A ligase PaaK-like adenylate-forming protein